MQGIILTNRFISIIFSTDMDLTTDVVAPLGAFSQSGHALQWGLIFGCPVVLTGGVRRAGWDVAQRVRGLRFRTMTETQPI